MSTTSFMGCYILKKPLLSCFCWELFPESDLATYRIGPEMGRSIEGRVLPLSDVHATFAVTEKEAVVFFPLVGGRTDFTGFVGKDPMFLNWVKDLFLYYWDKGKRV